MCEQENVCQLRLKLVTKKLIPILKKLSFKQTRKLAVIKQLENKEWKIVRIDHLKTYHDMKTQIDVPLKE